MYLEILVVIALTVVNGLLAMSELAVVSSRPARLKTLADRGSKGARIASRLAEDPGRFLSTVQIGITLVGVLSGAFSGATLGARLAEWLQSQGLSQSMADGLGVGAVVVAITYLSLILGELVPKQVALRDPERVAAKVAGPMLVLSKVAAPVVWVLDRSGKAVLALLGQRTACEERVTEEEVKTIIAEAESAGVLESDERAMITGVMRLAARPARAMMTPRSEVDALDLGTAPEALREFLKRTRRSLLPVHDGNTDEMLGVCLTKDALEALSSGGDIRATVHAVPVVMDTSSSLEALRKLRASKVHMALVYDEYGHFEGVVTPGDMLEAIVGAFAGNEDEEPALVARDAGGFLVAGWMPIDEFVHSIGIALAQDGSYQTVAGYVLAQLGRLPLVGESFERSGWRFEVVDLDGRRVDKVLVTQSGSESDLAAA